jgi:alkaline phosphatase D
LERANTVVLTGDIHTNWANELKVDFDDLDSPSVATEFVGTSISSGGNGYDQPKELNALLSENPFVKYHNGERGYVRCEVTATTWKTDYQTVPYVDKPGAPIQTRASFIVEHDRPTIERA